MAKPGNPAGRLYRILEEASLKSGDLEIKQVWAEIFSVDPDNMPELFNRLIKLEKLTETAEESIRMLPGINHSRFLSAFIQVKKVLAYHSNLNQRWNEARHELNVPTLTILEACSETLSARGLDEKLISEEELAELQNEIAALLERIMLSDIDEELKKILISRLEDIRRAILAYRIEGIEGLRQVLKTGFGSMFIDVAPMGNQQWTEEAKQIFHKYFAILEKIGVLIGLVTDVKGLLPTISKFLLGDGGGP